MYTGVYTSWSEFGGEDGEVDDAAFGRGDAAEFVSFELDQGFDLDVRREAEPAFGSKEGE